MAEYEDTVQSLVSTDNNISAKFRFLWTISDYLQVKDGSKRGESIKQKIAVNIIPEKFALKLSLYPKGQYSDPNETHASLFLVNVGEIPEALVNFKFSILDANNKEWHCHYSKELSIVRNPGSGFMVFPINISEEQHELDLLPVLPNGCLQILVEGTAWTDDPVETNRNQKVDVVEESFQRITSEISLFDSKEHSDAVLSVGDEEFHVHKSILASVFKKMFADSDQNIIVIPKIDPKAFRVILYFIYNNMLTAEADNMFPRILEFACKYKLNYLSEIAQIKLGKRVSVENCIDYLLLAEKCEAKELKEKILKFVGENRMDISVQHSSEVFDLLPKHLLLVILGRVMSQN